MKYLLATLGVNAVALGCIVSAAVLALNGKEGWGWFLLGGLLCAGSVPLKSLKD